MIFGLNYQSIVILGLLVLSVVFWLFQIWDDYLVSLMMAAGWVILAKIPFGVAFSTFSSTTWWNVFCALVLGVAFSKSGLLERIALKMLYIMPKGFVGQTLGLVLSGILV